MSPGVGEEVSTVTQSTVAALKSTPVVLALVIFNVLFMFLITYSTLKSGDRFERIIDQAFKACPSIREAPPQ